MTIDQLLKLPPAKLGTFYAELSDDERTNLTNELSAHLQAVCFLWFYMDRRAVFHRSHDDAAKEANDKLAKLRALMGFAYPDAGSIPA